MASSVGSRLSRDDFRKAKELEELRKTGAAPPELDAEGKMINPHIPQYISQAPWYYNATRPGLKHQYHSKFKSSQQQQLDEQPTGSSSSSSLDSQHRSLIVTSAASSRSHYVAGACENCGSLTHNVKQCLERPRKKNAKFGGDLIGRDEVLIEKKLDYDGKRDRWNGYDPREYKKVIEMHEKAEIERKKKKLEELEAAFHKDQQRHKEEEQPEENKEEEKESKDGTDSTQTTATATATAASSSSVPSGNVDPKESDLDKLKRLRQQKKLDKLRKRIAAATAATAAKGDEPNNNNDATKASHAGDTDDDSDTDSDVGSDDDVKDYGEVITRMDTKNRVTVRNLRIREDTAKYLRNLSANSAHYDPKTRSMRENPYPDKRPDEVLYAGDNFVRASGAVKDIAALQRYVWDQNEKQALKAELGLTHTDEDPESLDVPVSEVHAVALPSAAEKLYASYKSKRELAAAHSKHDILSRYGGEEHLIRPASNELLTNVQEEYVEYDENGQVIRGLEKAMRRSKYMEDVYEDGHTQVWGSWMSTEPPFKWGYECCHQTIRHCVCTGEAGKRVKEEMNREMYSRAATDTETQSIAKKEDGKREKKRLRDADADDDDDKTVRASEPLFRNKQNYHRSSESSNTSEVISESELDRYRRSQRHSDDPMNTFTDSV